MRSRQKAAKTLARGSRERIVLTLELPKNSIYIATCSGKGGGDPTRIAVKVMAASGVRHR